MRSPSEDRRRVCHAGAAPHYHGTSRLWKNKLKTILSNALYIENLLKIFRLSLIAKILTESILTGKQLLPLKAEFEIVFDFLWVYFAFFIDCFLYKLC